MGIWSEFCSEYHVAYIDSLIPPTFTVENIKDLEYIHSALFLCFDSNPFHLFTEREFHTMFPMLPCTEADWLTDWYIADKHTNTHKCATNVNWSVKCKYQAAELRWVINVTTFCYQKKPWTKTEFIRWKEGKYDRKEKRKFANETKREGEKDRDEMKR